MPMIDKVSQQSLSRLEKITRRKLSMGLLLLTIRECEEVTQKDFAEKLGISRQHLCDKAGLSYEVDIQKAA